MLYPKEIKCPDCNQVRFIDYRDLWSIKKGLHTAKCFRCSRPKKGETNSGCFEKGYKMSDESKIKLSLALKGKKKPPRTKEHSINLGNALKGKNVGEYNPMKKVENRIKNSEAQKGEKSNNWKGGKRTLKMLIRQSLEYRLWREAVFKRDNWTCVLCIVKGGKLEVDHYPDMFSVVLYKNNINSFEDALKCKDLWNINNGRTLCRKCHETTDTFGWKGNNLIRQSINN